MRESPETLIKPLKQLGSTPSLKKDGPQMPEEGNFGRSLTQERPNTQGGVSSHHKTRRAMNTLKATASKGF